MLICFSGHSFKYEIEAVAKLFFPVERFSLAFEEFAQVIGDNSNNIIFTRMKVKSTTTLLWVYASYNGRSVRASFTIPNCVDNYTDECERNLCVLLYKLLQELVEITPKWGVLTGVRPVSLIQKYIRKGWSKDEIYSYFSDKFLVSHEKLDLAYTTAEVQLDILTANQPNSYSLYVAIPFCVSKCSYCSFVSHPIKKNDAKVDEYVSLLVVELQKTAEIISKLGLSLTCVYIGGGTPTALTSSQLQVVVDAIAKYYPLEQVLEYTIEAGRVDTIDSGKLEVIKNALGQVGANEKTKVRISINPQTFNDSVLMEIGRNHNAQQVVECYNLALEMGFEHINMDFIAGLPTDTFESFKASMDKAISLSPSNITVHTLSIKRSAELFKSVETLSLDEVFATQYMNDYAEELLIRNGYKPYYLYRQKNTLGNLENVGYAKSELFCSIYNIYIMEEMHTIIACGAGGVTKVIKESTDKPINRIFNFKYHFEYISRFDEILKKKEEVSFLYE